MAERITGISLTPNEALFLLECMARADSEGGGERVGPEWSEMTNERVAEVARALVEVAGLDEDVARSFDR